MKMFWFEVVLQSHAHTFEGLAEAAYEAGCVDATPSMRDDVTRLSFARESESLESAIASAIMQLESIQCNIAKVEINDFGSLREAA